MLMYSGTKGSRLVDEEIQAGKIPYAPSRTTNAAPDEADERLEPICEFE